MTKNDVLLALADDPSRPNFSLKKYFFVRCLHLHYFICHPVWCTAFVPSLSFNSSNSHKVCMCRYSYKIINQLLQGNYLLVVREFPEKLHSKFTYKISIVGQKRQKMRRYDSDTHMCKNLVWIKQNSKQTQFNVFIGPSWTLNPSTMLQDHTSKLQQRIVPELHKHQHKWKFEPHFYLLLQISCSHEVSVIHMKKLYNFYIDFLEREKSYINKLMSQFSVDSSSCHCLISLKIILVYSHVISGCSLLTSSPFL